ncbi:fructose PTS transporter subunit IIA [Treponema parvum]|uniref:fructose PTS transporter subunit IIA n=1 Tax=Treponema parvum TaxID=138851 RepID=UPI001AEC39A9|nr:fructose PTS transporter subunit IIA [Treponema parvum]QTQ16656.1 cation:proton antiporter [Treponema parvum]
MEQNITEVMTHLVFQIAVIIFAVRIFGNLAEKVGIPSVLGELVAGIIIGPYALGTIPLPGFADGLFPLNSASLAVTPELYSFSILASIILLFSSGIETDLKLFLKYSVTGGIIGFGGVAVSFLLGNITAMIMLKTNFMDVRSLFLGIMSTATSVGITARILSDKKKMDSPEGVTILAAAVFDDVLGIVLLAVVMGIVSALSGGAAVSGGKIGLIAFKAFSIWLVFTALSIIFSKQIARFVRLFGGSSDFTIASFGIALVLAGIFEKHGLAMIIGAYTTGLALSSTEIAPVIQEKIHGIYKFFVPIFFAVMGMSVNIRELANPAVLIFGFVYTALAIIAKIIGCGGPAFLLGFNLKGAIRIGAGMIPRGEVALIIAGIGLTAKVIDQELFSVIILMTLVTTLAAPPLLNVLLGIKGRGTRKEIKSSESQQFIWDFKDEEIATLILDMFIEELRKEGFYIQMLNIAEGVAQARKGDVSLAVAAEGSKLNIQTAMEDMGFVKGEIYEVVLRLNNSLCSLEALKNTNALKQGLINSENRVEPAIIKVISKDVISSELKSTNKEDVLEELVWLLEKSGKVIDHKAVLADIKARENIMSTGLENGIALPHAKSDGVKEICVAFGIKKEGLDFNSLDKKPAKIFVMIVSPKSGESPQMQVMSSVTGILQKTELRDKLLAANSADEILSVIESVNKK